MSGDLSLPHAPAEPHAHRGAERNGRQRSRRALTAALAVTASVMVAEAVGGAITGSLALWADAAHMLTDVAALAMALMALRFASRPHSPRRTFGYHRLEVLAALANGIALWGIAAYIVFEAWQRFSSPPVIQGGPMLAVAGLGLLANTVSAMFLSRARREGINTRAALLHVLGDLVGSLGAITAGVLMLTFRWYVADPLVSVGIAGLLVVGAARLLWETTHILLEGTPPDVDLHDVESVMLRVPGVCGVHDLHVWTLTSGYNALIAHVTLNESLPVERHEDVLKALQHHVADQFAVHHATIQVERSTRECAEIHSTSDQPHMHGV